MDARILVLLAVVLLAAVAAATVAIVVAISRRPASGAGATAVGGAEAGDFEARLGALEEAVDGLQSALEERRRPAAGPSPAASQDELEALERRLRAFVLEARATGVAPGAGGGASPTEAAVLEALRREGYASTRLLGPADAEGAWRVEVEREGLIRKGVASLDREGRLAIRFESGLRAFP